MTTLEVARGGKQSSRPQTGRTKNTIIYICALFVKCGIFLGVDIGGQEILASLRIPLQFRLHQAERGGRIHGYEGGVFMMPISVVPIPLLAAVAPWMFYVPAVLLGVAILVRVVGWSLIKKAENDFKRHYPEQWKLVHPEEPEPEDDGSGKRPGQFGIFDLLVLITVAAVACAIVRLPIHFVLKMFAILALWLGFTRWVYGKPDARTVRSLAFKRRMAVMHALGSMLAIAPILWMHFVQVPRGSVFPAASFLLILLLGPLQAVWSAACAVSAEFAAGRSRKQRLIESR